MSSTARRSSRPALDPDDPVTLEVALDPAVLAADPESRQWLLALLSFGERAASGAPAEARLKPSRKRRRPARNRRGRK
jgi:hypothetical protein